MRSYAHNSLATTVRIMAIVDSKSLYYEGINEDSCVLKKLESLSNSVPAASTSAQARTRSCEKKK